MKLSLSMTEHEPFVLSTNRVLFPTSRAATGRRYYNITHRLRVRRERGSGTGTTLPQCPASHYPPFRLSPFPLHFICDSAAVPSVPARYRCATRLARKPFAARTRTVFHKRSFPDRALALLGDVNRLLHRFHRRAKR